LGLAGTYSFFSNKNLAVGEGGAAVTDDAKVAEQVRLLRSHGMTTLSWDRHRGRPASYDVVGLGFNYRIDEARAALAATRLHRLDRDNDRRRELDRRYRARFGDLGIACPLAPVQGLSSAHHLFTILLDEDVDRDGFRASLSEHGVQTSVHFPPAHQFSIYRDASWELPVTEDYARRSVTLPLFPHMTEEQQELVVDAVATAYGRVTP
jgi:dTDP-4-amino-4,6-dideoxygalactose transaminase